MKKDITKVDIFNLIAPIHVYFNADLMYENDAKNALKKLRKLKTEEVLLSYIGEDDLSVKKLDTLDSIVFWKAYNKLFEELVLEDYPELETSVDTYGAKCFMYRNNKHLDGDSYDCYPFYTNYAPLKERLNDLSEELYN